MCTSSELIFLKEEIKIKIPKSQFVCISWIYMGMSSIFINCLLIPGASNCKNTYEINNALLLQYWYIHLGPSVWAAACTYWSSRHLLHSFGFLHSMGQTSTYPSAALFYSAAYLVVVVLIPLLSNVRYYMVLSLRFAVTC